MTIPPHMIPGTKNNPENMAFIKTGNTEVGSHHMTMLTHTISTQITNRIPNMIFILISFS